MNCLKSCKIQGRSVSKTGAKTRRVSKKSRRNITLTICNGCGQAIKKETK